MADLLGVRIPVFQIPRFPGPPSSARFEGGALRGRRKQVSIFAGVPDCSESPWDIPSVRSMQHAASFVRADLLGKLMRNKSNRLGVETLYILGAGASYNASCGSKGPVKSTTPLDNDFCQRIVDLDLNKPAWIRESRDRIVKAWREPPGFNQIGLEQAIIRQLGNIEFAQAIRRRSNRHQIGADDYLNHLVHIICEVLRPAREGPSQLYRRFVNKVFPTGEGQTLSSYNNRVVTFNYDVLLDEHLLNRYAAGNVYFDGIRIAEGGPASKKFPHPLLIKLHGSTNWRCKSSDYNKLIDGSLASSDPAYRIPEVWREDGDRPSPNDEVTPLIMPPLPDKPLSRIKLFNFLWTKALEYLYEAREIVICGYSLPDADRLAVSLFTNFTNYNLRTVRIADPNPEILKKWRSLFRRSTVSKAVRWEYQEDFAELVERIS